MHPDGGLLGGRYELTEVIAGGGMGQVWQARDTRLDRDVAVKVLRAEYSENPTFLARFRAEAQHAAGLVHPDIATLLDYGEVDSPTGEHLAFLVMELVRGESLSTLLHRERRLGTDRTLEVLRHSAAGLGAAHAAGVVHRDVKPGNVLLGDDGSVKLTDFGVAVSATSAPLTRTGEVIGTANYLSPEQAQGGKATPASDVYALGLVGYECLAGHRGFDGGTPVQIAMRQINELPPPLPDDVPEPVRRVIERAIAKDPAARFTDGAALRAALDDVIGVGTPGAEPRTAVMPAIRTTDPIRTAPTPPPPFPATRSFVLPPDDDEHHLPPLGDDDDAEPRRRWPMLVAALVAVLVIGGGVVGFLTVAAHRPDTSAAGTTTSASAPPQVQLVSLTLTDYVGRPRGEVQSELVAAGLQVTLQPQERSDVPVDLVTAVGPVGQLPPGSVVTVGYAVAPPPPPPPPTPTPTPTPEVTQAPTPTAAPEDDGGDDGGDEALPTTREEWEQWIEDHGGELPSWATGRGNGRGHGGGHGGG